MARYSIIQKTRSSNGKQMYKTVRYPKIPRSFSDIYIFSREGDRYDILSQKYYNNSSFWWIISIANDYLPQNSLIPPIGAQIRIPSNITPILSAYNNLNK